MNPQFSQPKGSVSKETNKDSIARKFGCKKSEVLYAKPGAVLTGYKVIYDKVTQRSYALPSNLPAGATITSLTDGILVHNTGTVDLGALAVLRGEFVVLVEDFTSGFTIKVRNELVASGSYLYRWNGSLPKTVSAASTIAGTGGVTESTWVDTTSKMLGLFIRQYTSVTQVKADLSIPVGSVVNVKTYWPNIDGGAGSWLKTSETTTPNQNPADLLRPAFSDAAGNVFTLVVDNVRGIDIEQLGGKPYSSASPDLTTDLAPLLLALYKYQAGRGANTLTLNFKAREYYSSKGIPIAPWSNYRATGRFSTQFYIDPGLWSDTDIPPANMGGVNTFWSVKSFHIGVVHPANTHASNIDVFGFDFVTRAGASTDYGVYTPYMTEFKFSNVRCAGVDTALYYRNIYSGEFDRLVSTARTNTPTKAGSWGILSQERAAGVGCGTSVVFKNCNFTDFILGVDITAMTYTTFINQITEGTLTQLAATLRNCENVTVTQWGIERLTSTRSESVFRILGGNVTVDGVIAAYSVTANNTPFVEVGNGARVVLNGVNAKYGTGFKPDQLVYTSDDSVCLVGPITYPATGTYTNYFGSQTVAADIKGNLKARPDVYNAAALNSVTDVSNTKGKFMGRAVYASSLGCYVYASGPLATDVWRDGTGAIKYTPV